MFLCYTDEDPFQHSFDRLAGVQDRVGSAMNKFIRYDMIKRAETHIKKDFTTSSRDELYMKFFDEDGNLIGYSTVEQFDHARFEVLQVIPAAPGWWVVSTGLPDGFGAAPLIGWRNCTPIFAGPKLKGSYLSGKDIAVLVDPDGNVFSYREGHMIENLPDQFPKISEHVRVVLPAVVRKAIQRLQK